MADSLTPNLSLIKPEISAYDIWGGKHNSNMDTLDAASAALRGVPVSATAPTLNQVLKFNGTSWAPADDAVSPDASVSVKGISTLSVAPVSAGSPIAVGDNDPRMTDARAPLSHSLTAHSASTLAALNALLDVAAVGTTDSRLSDARAPLSHGLTSGSHSGGTLAALNALLDVAVVGTTDSRLSDSRAPSGSASGDLGSSYPSPTVIAIRGTGVVATVPTTGQVLKFDGTSWAPAAETGSASDASTTVKGVTKLSVAPASPTDPIAAGDNDPRMTDARTPTAHSLTAHSASTLAALNALLDVAAVATTDSRLSDSRAPNGTASGDLSGSFPSPTVAKLNGIMVTGTPIATQVLTATSGTAAQWSDPLGQPDSATTTKGISKLSVAPASPTDPIAVGDNDPRMTDARTPTAHSLTAHSASTLAALNALLDEAAVGTNDSRLSDSRAPNGSASGDLSGYFPSPTVAKINGITVTGTPTASQVLTASSGTAASWATPSGGSGGGYAKVVVAGPTGVAATDTAAIQAALTTASSTGGAVILREGLYLVNATLSLGAGVSLRGQGMGATALWADLALGANPLISSSSDFSGIFDMDIHPNVQVRGAVSSHDILLSGNSVHIERVSMVGHTASGSGFSAIRLSGGAQSPGMIKDCFFTVAPEFPANVGPIPWDGFIGAVEATISGCYFNIYSCGDIAAIGYATPTGNLSVHGNRFNSLIDNLTDVVRLSSGSVSGNRFNTSATITRSISTVARGGSGSGGVSLSVYGNTAITGGTNNGAIYNSTIKGSTVGNTGFSAYSGGATVAGNN